MVNKLGGLMAVVTIASASTVMAAAPAQADQSEYLRLLQPKYVYLNAQQLLVEGNKVCDAVGSGAGTSDVVNMVRDDLAVSVATAVDISTTAVVQLGC